jgi:hypothetical protein
MASPAARRASIHICAAGTFGRVLGPCDVSEVAELIQSELDADFDPLTDALEECRALAGFGDGVVHAIAARRDVIVSQCMTCSRLYRCVSAAGAPGGISSGWCSDQCAPRVPEPTDTPMELEEA